MRILLVSPFFPPFVGGIEKVLYELSARLAKHHEVHIVCSQLEGDNLESKVNGVFIHRVPAKEWKASFHYPPALALFAPSAKERVCEIIEKHNIDIVHLHNRWYPDFFLAAAQAKRYNLPLIITIHNARPLGINFSHSLFGLLYDLSIGQWAFRVADRVIAVSEWVRNDIAKYGVSLEKMYTIWNGVDTKAFSPRNKNSAVRKKLGVGKNPFLLYTGRIIPQKGLEYLISAMAIVHKQLPDVQLAIVGKGSELNSLKRKAKELNLEKVIHFPGFLSEQELKQAYCECESFVLPSVWEVFPIVILEAMASGCPIVCSDAGGNPEAVLDGTNGFVVSKRDSEELAAALIKVCGSKKLQNSFSKESRARAIREFDWDIIAKRTEEFYSETIALKKKKIL